MNKMNVVFICDNNYIIPTITAIYTLIASKKEYYKLNIYILGADITKENKEYFYKFNVGDNIISIIDVSTKQFEGFHKPSSNSYCVANESALLKFLIPNIFNNIDKILYLDGDIIIKKDLYSLYNTDISNYPLAAIKDSGSIYSKNLERKKFKKYFNSGVMLMNLDFLRKGNFVDKLIKAKKAEIHSNLMDQDIFNKIFDENVYLLPIKYNFLYINLLRSINKYTIEDINKLFSSNYSSLDEIKEDAYIIHFSSKDKPWKYFNVPYGDVWEYCFQQSPCKDAVLKRKPLVNNDKITLKRRIVVSLTSYIKRINTVDIVVSSMMNQIVKPDKIFLYLSKEEFINRDLPKKLTKLQGDMFEIIYCDDLKSHKKYFYTMQSYPNDIVITIDDDVYYPKTLIYDLIESYKKHPYSVSCMRGHVIKMYDDETFAPYKKWTKEIKIVDKESLLILPTGVGGILYPPNCMPYQTFSKEKIKKLCITTDDLWLKWMQLKNNVSCVLVKEHCKLNYIDNTQEQGLWKNNVYGKNNDIVWHNIINDCDVIDINGNNILKNLYNEYILQNNRTYKFYIKKVIQCYKDNGIIYTIKRITNKVVNTLKIR